MSVPNDAFESAQAAYLDSAIEAIQSSEFVALDLEFSGLLTTLNRPGKLNKYFAVCAESVPKLLTVQLGLCGCRRSDTDADEWLFSPFNLYILPSKRQIFSSDTQTVRWLSHNGFDFRRWITNGWDYARLEELQFEKTTHSAKAPECVKKRGVQRIIEAIILSEKPVIIHNGLLDILHIHDKFIGVLPTDISMFCSEWKRLFPAGTFDTKHIASKGKYSALHLADARGTTLSQLREHLAKKNIQSRFILDPLRCTSPINEEMENKINNNEEQSNEHRDRCSNLATCNDDSDIKCMSLDEGYARFASMRSDNDDMNSCQNRAGTDTTCDKSHEAGFDAMVTAQIFLMELELFFRYKYEQEDKKSQEASAGPLTKRKKRRKMTETQSDGSCPTPSIPSDWIEGDVCKEVVNIIEVWGVHPGCLNINELSAHNEHHTQTEASVKSAEADPQKLNQEIG